MQFELGEKLLEKKWTLDEKILIRKLLDNMYAFRALTPKALKQDIAAMFQLAIDLKTDLENKTEILNKIHNETTQSTCVFYPRPSKPTVGISIPFEEPKNTGDPDFRSFDIDQMIQILNYFLPIVGFDIDNLVNLKPIKRMKPIKHMKRKKFTS